LVSRSRPLGGSIVQEQTARDLTGATRY